MNTAYEIAQNEKRKIMEQAVFNAYAMLAVIGSRKDELSANEAYRLYGRTWVIDRTKRGMLKFSRNGATGLSAMIYSRFEIEALKRAEKGLAEAWESADIRSGSLGEFVKQRRKTEF